VPGPCNGDGTFSGTKRSALPPPADDPEEYAGDKTRKRVCQERKIPIAQQSTITPENGSNPDTNFLTDGAGLQNPLVQPTWTGNGKPSPLIYDGQFEVSGSTDRWIHYRWSAISAMDTMMVRRALPTSSDIKWLYYNVNRSDIQKLPFVVLSQRIQRSEKWREEGEQGFTVSACLRLAFPRTSDEVYGAFCRLACIVAAADAPEQNKS
jgi:hypothetical protein